MDRRTVIKSYFAISAGIMLLPACFQEKNRSSLVLRNIKINGDQELLLADLSEAIIPKTSTPGAKELSSHLFSLRMIDDCFDPPSQKKFVDGLQQFESASRTRFGVSFSNTTDIQKMDFMKSMENKSGFSEETLFFHDKIKELTIESFVSSQFYLTQIHKYELVPARFHGCFPVTQTS